jgi:Family of unknown function (DUF6152)
MRSQILIITVLALVAVFAIPSGVAVAHHSNAEYGDKMVTMNGTVKEYRWRNPHVTVVWDVKQTDGKVTTWRGELASVTSVMGHGLTKNSLKPGDEIKIAVFPSKLGTPESVIVYITRADGTVVLGWGQQGGASRKAADILDPKPGK